MTFESINETMIEAEKTPYPLRKIAIGRNQDTPRNTSANGLMSITSNSVR